MSTESPDSAVNPTAPVPPTGPVSPTAPFPPGSDASKLDSPKRAPASVPARPVVVEGKGKGKQFGKDELDKVKVTRTSGAWTAVIVGALLLIVLLIFIAENTEPTRVHLLLWWVELPLGVLLLFSLIIGVLATGLIGGARIFQVWRAARKSHKE